MQMPPGIGPFHIVGIGGIGMSAIAEVLHTRGYEERGSAGKLHGAWIHSSPLRCSHPVGRSVVP